MGLVAAAWSGRQPQGLREAARPRGRSAPGRRRPFVVGLLLATLAPGWPALATTIATVAGNGTTTTSGDGGPATAAGFAGTGFVAVDSAGNLFVQDLARIRRVDAATGIITTVAGNGTAGFSGDGGPATAARILVNGLAVDGAGNIFLADEHDGVIRRVDTMTGVITTLATGFERPDGLATDAAGNLFIAESFNGSIRRIDAGTGDVTTAAGGGLNHPTLVAVDGMENLYIFESNENRITRVDATTGTATAVVGGGAFAGDGGLASLASFTYPGGLAVDGAGDVFIADYGVSRVRRVDAATGIITTVVGNGTAGYAGDGAQANAAEINLPHGLAVDGGGNLYIADDSNRRVRLMSLAPETCGDGVPNPGEPCDAGAAHDPPASCCTAACQAAFAGSACSDRDACTQDDHCDGTTGLCGGGGPVDCDNGDPCSFNTCNVSTGCLHEDTAQSLGSGELGCIPPSREAMTCSRRVNQNTAKLTTALLRCHTKLAAAALAQASFDEVGCEATAQAKYAAANAKLVGCLACLDPVVVGATMTSLIEPSTTGMFYCDATSGVPLADADAAGFVPANHAAANCAVKSAHALWRLIAVELNCHTTLASDDVVGQTFNVGSCESEAQKRFNTAAAKLTACPACLTTQLPALAGAIDTALDQQNVLTYCSS
jgi:sugar lactone lactonase YvrE